MSSLYSSRQLYASGAPPSRPLRANTPDPNDILASSRPSRRPSFPQAVQDRHGLPFVGPNDAPSPSTLNGGTMVGRSRSTLGKSKKGIFSFISRSSASKRPEISLPYNAVHLTHVHSSSSSGEFTGLPKEWERILQKDSCRYEERNQETMAVADALEVYQGTAGGPGKIASRGTAPSPTFPQQINGGYDQRDALHDSSTQRTKSSVPPGIIDYAADFILNYPRQPHHDVQGDQAAGLDGTLRETDNEIDVMEETLENLLTSLRASLTAPIIKLKKERNILVRFHQLPLEIASEILWLSVADPWKKRLSYSFLQRLQTILSVCSSWRTVVECSPHFWSIVELTASPRAITTLLEKSKPFPLEVKCFSDGSYSSVPYAIGRDDLELLASHAHRIRSLILSAGWTEGILALLDRPAPALEELKLSSRNGELTQPIDLFSGQAARLKYVVLENIPIRWDSEALVGLRSLQIKANPAYLPTEADVLRLLEANPSLEKLDMEHVTVTEEFEDSAGPTHISSKRKRMIMSNIQDIRLANLPFKLVRVVLGAVDIPSIRRLDLQCRFQGHPVSQLLGPSIKHLVQTIIQRSAGAELAELTIGEESVGFSIFLPDQDPAIRIQLNNTAPVSGCEWFAENLLSEKSLSVVQSSEILRVGLKFGDGFDMRENAFVPILDRLRGVEVEHLTIGRGCADGEELVKYLGRINEDFRWPLPYLTSLTIATGYASTASHILAALQGRKHGDEMTGITELQVLNIEGLGVIDAEVEDALAELIGPTGTFIRAAQYGRARSSVPHAARSWRSSLFYPPSTLISTESDTDIEYR